MSGQLEVPMTRTLIYEGESTHWRWSDDMLTAISSAKALGVPVFEISLIDDARSVPVVEASGKDYLGQQTYQTTGSRMEGYKRVRVHAVRVDVSDEQ